jgi:hypothetical protein
VSAVSLSASMNDNNNANLSNLIRVFMEKTTPVEAQLLKVVRVLKLKKRLTTANMKLLLASLVNQ